jgi:orotate phosphoribosyltransferase
VSEHREALAPEDLQAMLEESGAYASGHFELSSGRHSPAYVQCALLLQDPERARRVGRALARRLASLRPETVVSPALGGVIIGHEVAAALGVPFRFTERKDGEMTLRRGFAFRQGERAVIVEDVVTTGKSTREAASVVEGAGGKVLAVGSIVDRTGQPRTGDEPFDVPFFHLMELELPTWPADECPLCREGGTAVKPGSRPKT